MSVLIKGMEMPALCQECDLYIDGACYAKGYRDYRSIMDMSKPADCPLIEIHTPPERKLQKLAEEIAAVKRSIKSENSDYLTGYLSALSAVEGMIAEESEVTT